MTTPEQFNDGGPAFPHQDWDSCIKSQRLENGMSLRDYFAAAALQAFTLPDIGSLDPMEFARASYDIADAMIEVRKGGA